MPTGRQHAAQPAEELWLRSGPSASDLGIWARIAWPVAVACGGEVSLRGPGRFGTARWIVPFSKSRSRAIGSPAAGSGLALRRAAGHTASIRTPISQRVASPRCTRSQPARSSAATVRRIARSGTRTILDGSRPVTGRCRATASRKRTEPDHGLQPVGTRARVSVRHLGHEPSSAVDRKQGRGAPPDARRGCPGHRPGDRSGWRS